MIIKITHSFLEKLYLSEWTKISKIKNQVCFFSCMQYFKNNPSGAVKPVFKQTRVVNKGVGR